MAIHTHKNGEGRLGEVLGRAGHWVGSSVRDGERVVPHRIYVAPPDRHVIVVGAGVLRLTEGPVEHRVRPAIDPLFRSAAAVFGHRVVAVLLSGMLHDGVEGLAAVRLAGGLCVVQDPDDALFSSMPRAALAALVPDHCLPVADIAPLLVRLSRAPTFASTLR